MAREIVFDTETTGLSPADGDRITEIGCVEVVDFIPTGREFHVYVNPQRHIPEKVVEITGLTEAFLADKPLFGDVVEGFREFVGEDRLVAHNASFDRGFVNAEMERAGLPIYADERFLDTLELARVMFPGSYNSLDALCKRFAISLDERVTHGALVDARLLAEVYLELNGGRERRLDLSPTGGPDAAPAGETASVSTSTAAVRRIIASDDERAAHDAFLAEAVKDAIWARAD